MLQLWLPAHNYRIKLVLGTRLLTQTTEQHATQIVAAVDNRILNQIGQVRCSPHGYIVSSGAGLLVAIGVSWLTGSITNLHVVSSLYIYRTNIFVVIIVAVA